MATLDLPPSFLETTRRLLGELVPEADVLAFGSRVSGTGHEASDLDLVLRLPSGLPVALDVLAALRTAFSESDLPILVDVQDWARIPESFRREIEREHVWLQHGSPSGAPTIDRP